MTNQHSITITPAGMTYERALEIAVAVQNAAAGPDPEFEKRIDEAITKGIALGWTDPDMARYARVDVASLSRRRRQRGIGTLYERQQESLRRVRADRAESAA